MPRFSDTLMEHVQDPQNRGPLPERTHLGVYGQPERGPYFILQLQIKENHVAAARFECNACGITVACGSLLTEWLHNRNWMECQEMTEEKLAQLADGLPSDKQHCAAMAIQSLQLALFSNLHSKQEIDR